MMRSLNVHPRRLGPIGCGILAALLATLAALASLASPALAAPRTPTLGGTYPSSPGISTTPRVFGWVSEISTSGVGQARGAALAAALGEEEGTIAIYADPNCAGPEVASGTASELENSGIQVTVGPGSTTFSATNSDLSGVSGCSNAVSYQQVSDPPGTPAVTGVTPASPADNNLPRVTGSADIGSTVAIYTNSSCSGSPVATGAASAFSTTGIQAFVADNSTTTFYARASWAELPSGCSSTSTTYQEVTVASPPGGGGGTGGGSPGGGVPGVGGGSAAGSKPPTAPKLRTVPGGRANNSMPLVTGSVAGGAKVQIYKNSACDGQPVASGPASQLADGFAISVAEDATTRFYGEAIDAAGRVSDCSVPTVYIEDSSPPHTRITFGPGVKTRKRVAIFRFMDITDDPPGTTFVCKFDRRPWKACQAPLRVPRLKIKAHTLRVRAIDEAGNEEAKAAKRRFKVVSAP